MTKVECQVDLASWVVVHVYFVKAFDINFMEVVLYASFHFLQDHLVQYLYSSAFRYFALHHVTKVVLYTSNYFTTAAAYNQASASKDVPVTITGLANYDYSRGFVVMVFCCYSSFLIYYFVFTFNFLIFL